MSLTLPFSSNSLTCLEKIDSNLYLAGTTGAGLFNFSFFCRRTIYNSFDTANGSVPDNYILDVKKDLFEVVWIGTESVVWLNGQVLLVFQRIL